MKGDLSKHQQHYPIRECQTSEEEESPSSGGNNGTNTKKTKKEGSGTEGATIEVVRRPRGRPPGSKNKPKPPIIITRDADSALQPHILQIPGGIDVVDAISCFARRHSIGLCVLTGTGTVANVTLRQPSTTPGATVTFHGRFDILSLSATFLPPSSSSSSSSSPSPFSLDGNGFSISLAGAQGQIFGGFVVGSLLAAGTVIIVAAAFTTPTFHRLPIEDEVSATTTGISTAVVDTAILQTPTMESAGGSGGGAMSIYSSHLPSHVIWAPTARQQPPPPHY
ncbi:AT-hook motif nuclear-localized protein 17-like [Magnolia sinica]|uniref:AT-hook motif nuclear-localized protein 17-like n=1 Tax=Magnolia sinica TaxID=86752 RepID=UPI0026589D76|nr:AT-hook motif nuclear-localized protein 17-like [Magnolia sinica]